MRFDDLVPRALPASGRSLAAGVPPAPPGTIFALSAEGGFAVPPRKFTLHFGRAIHDVHIPVGVRDRHVSRLHGVLVGDGREWWIQNRGRLPIQLPGRAMLLSGNEVPLEAGYTPLLIGSSRRRSHLLEVHVVESAPADSMAGPDVATAAPEVYDLGPAERLVLTSLAQRYLRQERYPQPVSWKLVADDLNRAAPDRSWTAKTVEHVVSAVRKRLATGPTAIPGILREDGIGEPVGNTLNHNLIQALLATTTLIPADLQLLGDV